MPLLANLTFRNGQFLVFVGFTSMLYIYNVILLIKYVILLLMIPIILAAGPKFTNGVVSAQG